MDFLSSTQVIINTEVRSVPVTKKGVYFALRDQGACLSIIAIRIFYITCPNITTNFAFYPETPTGKELTTIVETDGECVSNAHKVEIPRLLCKGDGNWTLPSGGCKCLPGYEPLGQSCQGESNALTSQLDSPLESSRAFASNCLVVCAMADCSKSINHSYLSATWRQSHYTDQCHLLRTGPYG